MRTPRTTHHRRDGLPDAFPRAGQISSLVIYYYLIRLPLRPMQPPPTERHYQPLSTHCQLLTRLGFLIILGGTFAPVQPLKPYSPLRWHQKRVSKVWQTTWRTSAFQLADHTPFPSSLMVQICYHRRPLSR